MAGWLVVQVYMASHLKAFKKTLEDPLWKVVVADRSVLLLPLPRQDSDPHVCLASTHALGCACAGLLASLHASLASTHALRGCAVCACCSINVRRAQFEDFYKAAKAKDFEVYVAELSNDVKARRSGHERDA